MERGRLLRMQALLVTSKAEVKDVSFNQSEGRIEGRVGFWIPELLYEEILRLLKELTEK